MSLTQRIAPKNNKCNLPGVSHEYFDNTRISCNISEPEKSLPLWLKSQKVENDSTVQMVFERKDYVSQLSHKQRLAHNIVSDHYLTKEDLVKVISSMHY